MLEKEKIELALKEHWNIRPAAEALGIGYSTLRKYIKNYNIQHNSRKTPPWKEPWDKKKYDVAKITKFRKKRKLEALEYKGGMKCSRCGFDEPIPDCYAFHHRDPSQKDLNWNKMKVNNWRFERIKLELDKCDVLCHNCHSTVHYLERQN